MSTDRETTRIVRSWLEEGVTALPDRVLDTVLDQLPTTHQRRSWWPLRRFVEMNTSIRFGLATVVVLAAAAIGLSVLPRLGFEGPGVVVTPSPSPTQPASPFHEGSLAPGRYRVHPLETIDPTLAISFTVPEGWRGFGNWALISDAGTSAPNGTGIGFLSAAGLFSDPCHWDKDGDGSWPRTGDISVGPTAHDLAFAIHYNYEIIGPRSTVGQDVVLSGYTGKRQDLTMPSDIDFSTCDKVAGQADGSYLVWGTSETNGNDLYAQGAGQRWHLWILDVQQTRLIVVMDDYVETTRANRAAAYSIIESISIEK